VTIDPRRWAKDEGVDYPTLDLPDRHSINTAMLVPPLEPEEAQKISPVKGPNISRLPDLEPLLDEFEAPVLLKARKAQRVSWIRNHERGRPANGGARQLQRGARSTVSCPGHPADGGHETNRLPRPHFLGCAPHGSE
jgi:hypothetical protein